jgi:hypothetical protein
MPTYEYHIKQAKVAAHLALTERDPARAANFHLMALEHYEKAEKVKVGQLESRAHELLGEGHEASPISNSAALGSNRSQTT